MLVAGHRGVRVGAVENTMQAFHMAAQAGVDMIETDVRMTEDGVLILMHDETIDRTTRGTGKVREMTYAVLHAAAPEVPTLWEFLEGTKVYEKLTYNFELKDYPEQGEERAWECMRKTIAMIEEFSLADRCVVNSFSGRLLEKVDEEFNHRYRLHGFYGWHNLGHCDRDPMQYLFCACMCGYAVYSPKAYQTLFEGGVEPWVGASVKTKEQLECAVNLGAKLVTSDDPIETLRILREIGAHE